MFFPYLLSDSSAAATAAAAAVEALVNNNTVNPLVRFHDESSTSLGGATITGEASTFSTCPINVVAVVGNALRVTRLLLSLLTLLKFKTIKTLPIHPHDLSGLHDCVKSVPHLLWSSPGSNLLGASREST